MLRLAPLHRFTILLLTLTWAAPTPTRAATADQRAPSARGAGIRFTTDFECGLNHPVKFVGGTGTNDDPAHFSVKFTHGRMEAGFFMFRLDGVKGKTVIVDMHTDRASHWDTLNPVFAYINPAESTDKALAAPELFACRPPPHVRGVTLAKGLGGSKLPFTLGIFQRWRYMSESGVKWEKGKKGGGHKSNLFRVEHTFDETNIPYGGDSVVVAMKVPYTPKLCDALMQGLQKRWDKQFSSQPNTLQRVPRLNDVHQSNADWKIIQVGHTEHGRPLWLVRIGQAIVKGERNHAAPEKRNGEGNQRADILAYPARPYHPSEGRASRPSFARHHRLRAQAKPCILVYAREHSDEHDGSWVAQGVIDFMLGSNPAARAIRHRFTVLVIPMLDPDGAVQNVYHTRVVRGFVDDPDRPTECLQWATWLEKWVDRGNRLDMVIDLHNVESGEGLQLFPYMYEPPKGGMRARMSKLINKSVIAHLPGYRVQHRPGGYGTFRTRLGGWLRKFFGTHLMFYEVNSQAPGRHLSLYQVKVLGVGILKGVTTFFYSSASAPLRQAIQHDREARYARFDRYGWLKRLFPEDQTVFGREQMCQVVPRAERFYTSGQTKKISNWIKPLLRRYGRSGPPPIVFVHDHY